MIERGQTRQDPDMDGLNNYQELFWGTDPRNADTDGDSYKSNFRDGTEVNYWMKKGYGVTEIRQYSSTRDSDSDGLRDGWEVYYGLNPQDEKNSKAFHNRIKKTGAILRTKLMKFIKKDIDEALFFQRRTMTLFDGKVKSKIYELIDELKRSGIIIEEPKCNFDVELSMDMLDDIEKFTAVMLLSGDSDLLDPLERLRVKGKKIGIVGVRGMVAGELHGIKDKYIDFGKFYTGKKIYPESENPAFGGTA